MFANKTLSQMVVSAFLVWLVDGKVHNIANLCSAY